MEGQTPFDGKGPDEHWSQALARGVFLLQRCRSCGTHRFPPALVCGACGAGMPEWVEASGAGTVHSTTTVRAREGDYNVSLIDLAEGCRLMSRVEGVAPEAVAIGMAVRAGITADPEPVLVFRPERTGGR
jgi:uncharacterized OB-fold protein